MGNLVSSSRVRAQERDPRVGIQKCVVKTWSVAAGPYFGAGLLHDSGASDTYIPSNLNILHSCMCICRGTYPENVSPTGSMVGTYEMYRQLRKMRGMALVPESQRSPGRLILAHVGAVTYSLSNRGGIKTVNKPLAPWRVYSTITALACDSTGRIATIYDGSRTVRLRTLQLPASRCDCNIQFDAATRQPEQVSCITCLAPRYEEPRVVAETVCDHPPSSWTRLVAIAYDSQDRLYVLDLNDQPSARTLMLWSYASDACTAEWRLIVDLSDAYRHVTIVCDDPFTLVIDTFGNCAFIAHGTCVHATRLDGSLATNTTRLLAGDGRVSGRTDGSGIETRFAKLSGCALHTRPLDFERDVAPVVAAVRAAVVDPNRSQSWPTGVANIVEQYARECGDPVVGLLLRDDGNLDIRQLDFLT